MDYTKAIFLMSGEVITITDKQEEVVKEQLRKGAEWIDIEGQLINTKSISKVGGHHATAYMKKTELAEKALRLRIEDKKILPEPDYYIDERTGEKMYS